MFRGIKGGFKREGLKMDQWISGSVDQWISGSLDHWIKVAFEHLHSTRRAPKSTWTVDRLAERPPQ